MLRTWAWALVSAAVGCASAAPPVDDLEVEAEATPAGWSAVGTGVIYRAMPGATGERAFLFYGGYTAQLPWVAGWAQGLWDARLRDLGVKHVYAVQGPRDSGYGAKEIANSKLARHLLPLVKDRSEPIGIAAHSSGAFVAHELFGQLATTTYDPTATTKGRIVYFDLEGGGSGLNAALVGRLAKAYFVSATDPKIGTSAQNISAAKSLASTYAPKGVYLQVDATGSGCNAGARWCMHDTVVNTRPHNHGMYDLARDYTDFAPPRAVVTAWVDAAPELR